MPVIPTEQGDARPRRDDDRRHSRAEAVEIGVRGRHVIEESAEVVPRQHHRRGRPIRALHQRVEVLHGPVLADADAARGVIRAVQRRREP